MALWVCGGTGGCGTKYAVGLFSCPRCHNTEFFEDGDPMAKITRHGGASDKTLPAPEVTPPEGGAWVSKPGPMTVEKPSGGAVVSAEALREHARNLVEPDFSESLAKTEATETTQEEGGDKSSPGSSSSASTEKPQPTSEPSETPTPKRARKTASRSAKATTDNSSAPSTAGDQTEATSAADETAE